MVILAAAIGAGVLAVRNPRYLASARAGLHSRPGSSED